MVLMVNCGGMGGGNPGSSSEKASALATESAIVGDVLRVGDTITIRLTGVPEGDVNIFEEKINDDGYISMPLVGRFKAAGKRTSDLKDDIESAYRNKKIYQTPNITIIPESRFVNVNGEVRSPQRVQFTNDLTALGAITACGGFTEYANRRSIRISRSNQIIQFDAQQAINDPKADIPLQAGDHIEVLRTIW